MQRPLQRVRCSPCCACRVKLNRSRLLCCGQEGRFRDCCRSGKDGGKRRPPLRCEPLQSACCLYYMFVPLGLICLLCLQLYIAMEHNRRDEVRRLLDDGEVLDINAKNRARYMLFFLLSLLLRL